MNRVEAMEFAKEQQEIFGGRMGEFLKFVEDELSPTNASNTLNALDSVDLISRQAAIDAVNKAFDRETLLTGFVRSIAVSAIGNTPSAQSERKKGKWIVYYECPKCGEITKDFTKYCPFCNADMREETEDADNSQI